MTTIRRLPGAIVDVTDIWQYIHDHDPAAADRTVTRIIHASDRLIDFPYSGSPRPEIASSARSIAVGNYTLYYQVVDDMVEIVRVIHSSRKIDDVITDFNRP